MITNTNPSAAKGYFTKILAIDSETSGIAMGCDDPSYDPVTGTKYQAISWGLIVADVHTLEPIDQLYVEVKHDPAYAWSPEAERIHGISREYLEANGVSRTEAVEQIGGLILSHWGPNTQVNLLGTNVVGFDLPFLRSLMNSEGLRLNFSHRHVDTTSIGVGLLEHFNSEDMLRALGLKRASGVHNSLEDAYNSLMMIKRVREYMQALENAIDS
jgi:DNA polymerase III epsilon subunit-like protein